MSKQTTTTTPKLVPLLLAVMAALGVLFARPAVTKAEAPAAGGAHGAADHKHVEGDERLAPIPPSKDTFVAAIWVIVIFLVMLAVLYPTAWKQVLAGLKKREQRIRQDIADAEAAREKADATLREYNARLATAEQQVRDMLNKATVEAQQIGDQLKARAEQEAQERKERALQDIERAKTEALGQIYDEAATLATSVAEKILQRNLNADDQRDLVNRSLEQMRAVGRN